MCHLPIIGMSPGNSYFKNKEVAYLLRESIRRYGKTAVMVLDEPATSTYLAMGYSLEKATKKARLQGNGLKNKTISVLNSMGLDSSLIEIIDRSNDIASHEGYLVQFEKTIQLYKNNSAFMLSVQCTSKEVLENSGKEYSQEQLEQATHYLLSEIAFLEFAPTYFGVDKINYIYHKPRRVYEDYIAGIFDGCTRSYLDFILLEAPYETYLSLGEKEYSRLQIIQNRGSIRCSYIPYILGFLHINKDGSLSGLFYDVIKDISSHNNLSLEFTEQSGYGVIASRLNQGFIDVFCTPVRPTKARRLEMFFSKSLASSNIYGYVHEDSQYADLSLEDLKNNTKIRIAVKENDTHHDIVQKYFSYARIVRLPQLAPVGTEIEYVLDNRADIAFWEDKLVDKYLVDRDIAPDILIQKGRGNKPVEIYDNCIALPRGEFELKDIVDASIDKFI